MCDLCCQWTLARDASAGGEEGVSTGCGEELRERSVEHTRLTC